MHEPLRFREAVPSRRLRGARSDQQAARQQGGLRPDADRLCFFDISTRLYLDSGKIFDICDRGNLSEAW